MEERIDLPWPEWKIIGVLGKGAFGCVYRVQKAEYGHISDAAVKIIRVVPDEQKKRELENSGISVESYLQDTKGIGRMDYLHSDGAFEKSFNNPKRKSIYHERRYPAGM